MGLRWSTLIGRARPWIEGGAGYGYLHDGPYGEVGASVSWECSAGLEMAVSRRVSAGLQLELDRLTGTIRPNTWLVFGGGMSFAFY